MRRIVIVGRLATASDDFNLEDVAGTSGRLDVLLRCIRAALLFSHGARRDVVLYLVLQGGALAPRVVRIEGGATKFLRPDERTLSILFKKILAYPAGEGFVTVRPGIDLANGGLELVVKDLGASVPYVLDEGAADVRDTPPFEDDAAFFVGDHLGFDPPARAILARIGARAFSVGPVSVHAEDAITILHNELDRREAAAAKP